MFPNFKIWKLHCQKYSRILKFENCNFVKDKERTLLGKTKLKFASTFLIFKYISIDK